MDETTLLIRNFEYDGLGPSKSSCCNVIFVRGIREECATRKEEIKAPIDALFV